jgi:hypothetical protein
MTESHYFKVTTALREHLGERVRITAPNGAQRTATVGWYEYAPGEDEVTLDGHGGGSILHNAWKVETKGPNGRYSVAHEWPEQREQWEQDWAAYLERQKHPEGWPVAAS